MIGSVSSRTANSNRLKIVVQSNNCSTTEVIKLNRIGLRSITESSICSPIIELKGKKMSVVRLWPAEKAYYNFFFAFFRRTKESAKRARSTARHDTRTTGECTFPSRASLELLARFALALPRRKKGLNRT